MAKRVLLLYSGGLDTSVICKWLVNQGYEVVCFAADLGQPENFSALKRKALASGAAKCVVSDLKERFVRDFVFPALQMNALYEGRYLLGTSLARPCIAEEMVRVAKKEKCTAFSHGATGKGNDQVRFELTAAALAPCMEVIAPWREPAFHNVIKGRQEAIAYAREHKIPVKATSAKPYSMDENLMHISYESGVLEDPSRSPQAHMFRLTADPRKVTAKPQKVKVDFREGVPIRLNGRKLPPAKLLDRANKLGGKHGIGRVDMVESRFVGMKSRGVYETPGGTLLLFAHRDLEGIAMDRDLMNLRDTLMPRFAALVYNGYWFSREMDALRTLLSESQRYVTGAVRLELCRGNITVLGRESPHSLYDERVASMDDDQGAFDQSLSTGFIRIHGLPLRAHARRCRRRKA